MPRLQFNPSLHGRDWAGSSLVSLLAEQIRRGAPLPPVSGGGEDPPAEPPAPSPPAPAPVVDVSEGFKKLLEKHNNDAVALAAKLHDENHSYRQKNSSLKAKVPADGSLVLDADQAKAWTAYVSLGKPEEITVIKTEHDQFATERQAAAREKLHGEIAEAHGYRVPVLSRLIDQDKLEVVEIKEAKNAAGKTVKTAHVKDGDKVVTLPEYAKAHWSEFLDSLPITPASKPIGTPRTSAAPTRTETPASLPRRSLVS